MSTLTIGLSGTTVTPATGTQTIAPGDFDMGVNLSGMELNPGQVGNPYYNYAIPSLSELQYYKSQGVTLIRLPFSWEHLQPTLGGAFNATYLSEMEGVVNEAASLGMKVILDCHDYGGYSGSQLGSTGLSDSQFASMWQQLATVFAGNTGIAGYDLMNEPHDMPSAQAWPDAAQAAISAIRTVDASSAIYVEGDGWSSAGSWTAVNSGLASLYDPSNNLIFSAHLYLDTDNSGTHYDWAQQAAAGDTTEIGVQRLTNFVQWLQANNLKGDIGEIGVGNDNTNWLVGLSNTLAYAQASNLQVTYWAGGPWWGTYPYSVEPTNGVSAPQMAVLDRFSGDMPTVTSASLSGVADANSTVYLIENNVTLATTTANSSGQWSYTLTGLALGAHTIVSSNVAPGQDGTLAAVSFILAAASGASSTPVSSNPMTLYLSEDAYAGDAQFTVTVDGVQVGGTYTATASHAAGALQAFTLAGPFTNTSHVVSIDFLNDAFGGTSTTDRNLYLSSITFDGVNAATPLAMMSSGTQSVVVQPATGSGSSPVVVTLSAPTVNVFVPMTSGAVTGSTGQNDFRFATAGITNTITNFQAGSAGDTVQLMGASSYTTANFDYSDILWDNGPLTPFAWEVDGTRVVGAAALGGTPGANVMGGFHIAAVGDFTGDGTSSVLLVSNAPNGSTPSVIWNIANGTLSGGAIVPYGSPSTKAWAGDFNGDGTSDILWDNGSSTPYIWLMQNDRVVGAAALAGPAGAVVMPGYHIGGVGDFNGDGDSDILWLANAPNPASPAIIWFMDGLNGSAAALPYGATPGNAWIADFNGDGKSDILWDNGSATPVLWEMSATTVIGVGILGGAYGSTVMPGYHIAGVGDFNGDGDADILWAANVTSAAAPSIIWFMDGTTVTNIAFLPYGATATSAWIGNFNVDGTKITSNTGSSVILSGVAPTALTSNNVALVSSTLDYSAQTSPVVVDLATGASSVATGSVSGYSNVIGTNGNDTLQGLAPTGGTSTLTGNGGSDDYLYNIGEGAVTVVNGLASANAAAGEVIFGAGITDGSLWLSHVGNNLVMDVLGTQDQVTVKNWFTNSHSQVTEIVDANGLKLDAAVSNLVTAMASFGASNPAFNPQATGTTMPTDTTLAAAVTAAWHS